VTLTVHDQDHNPVAGATISGTWSGGASGSGSCLTGAGGACSILSPKIATAQPSITFAVDGVTHPSLPYEPAANHDPDGDSDGTSVLVSQAGNLPPEASFTYSCTDLACEFDGSGSTDPDGSVVSYAWDLGDGTSATGPSPSHTYAAAGTYPVILTVTDNEGATGADSQAVSAGGSPAATMFVQDISLSGKAAGPNRTATAVVTIRDTNGNPVPGATVYATWSGDDSGSVSGVTAADGTVSFTSGRVRHADATFTFTVDDLLKDGFVYQPELNTETSDTIAVP
jgi:PKD repeat protein